MQIAIVLFPEFTALDVIGPYQVFSYLPGAEVLLCAAQTGIVSDDLGMVHLDITTMIADVPTPDVVVVPGGQITHRMARDGDPVIDWIRRVTPTARFTTSVCTGALLLGAAGLLDGLRATTHWTSFDVLSSFGAEPSDERIVVEDGIVTAAGVSAGIDLAFALVGRMAGQGVAQAIQLGIEYDPQPPFDAGTPSKAPVAIRGLVHGLFDETRAAVLNRA